LTSEGLVFTKEKEKDWLNPDFRLFNMTNADLQDYMHNIIRKRTVNDDTLVGVNSSLARIWKKARQQLHTATAALTTTAGGTEPHL
jgi:hypothetical protein